MILFRSNHVFWGFVVCLSIGFALIQLYFLVFDLWVAIPISWNSVCICWWSLAFICLRYWLTDRTTVMWWSGVNKPKRNESQQMWSMNMCWNNSLFKVCKYINYCLIIVLISQNVSRTWALVTQFILHVYIKWKNCYILLEKMNPIFMRYDIIAWHPVFLICALLANLPSSTPIGTYLPRLENLALLLL